MSVWWWIGFLVAFPLALGVVGDLLDALEERQQQQALRGRLREYCQRRDAEAAVAEAERVVREAGT